jgi:transcriptional regulator with XRE-family HTH domain
MATSRIGESLKTARARLGWSREALAFHSGVSWSAIAQIESGRRKDIRLSSLSALSNALGVSIDYLAGSTAALTPHLFEHRLLTYESDEEYLEGTVPFIAEGLEQSHTQLVVAAPPQVAILRESLDDRADHVEFADSADWYSSLAGALNRYRAFVKEKVEAGATWVRVVGDPVWAGRSDAESAAWFRYESLVNLAFAAAPATIVCAYDASSFSEEVISFARVTHPVAHGGVFDESVTYRETEDFLLEPPEGGGH